MALLRSLPLLVLLAVTLAGCSAAPGPGGDDSAGATGGEATAGSAHRPAREPASGSSKPPVPGDHMLPAEVATVGFEALSGAPVVLVRELESGKVVPIWVGLAEARAIATALHGIELPRPMTHDLTADLLAALDAELVEVWVHSLVGGTYLGALQLQVAGRDEPLFVDCRPSDGLALALRTGATILLARELVAEAPEVDFLAPEANEQVVRGLGLTVVAPTPALRQELGLPDRPGLVVTSAVDPAASAGLARGDLIVEIEGKVPAEPLDFLEALTTVAPGQPLELVYWRDGEEHRVQLVGELPGRRGPRQVA